MKIEGCTVGNHLFVGAKKDEVGAILSKMAVPQTDTSRAKKRLSVVDWIITKHLLKSMFPLLPKGELPLHRPDSLLHLDSISHGSRYNPMPSPEWTLTLARTRSDQV